MKKKIDGQEYRNLIDFGLRNLALYKDEVNTLNVFPVPDGDTGTNMVMTLQNGYVAIKESGDDLSDVSKKFANAIVFGARGNSGVIMSQFFKGISEYFFQMHEEFFYFFIHQNSIRKKQAARQNIYRGVIATILFCAFAYIIYNR